MLGAVLAAITNSPQCMKVSHNGNVLSAHVTIPCECSWITGTSPACFALGTQSLPVLGLHLNPGPSSFLHLPESKGKEKQVTLLLALQGHIYLLLMFCWLGSVTYTL